MIRNNNQIWVVYYRKIEFLKKIVPFEHSISNQYDTKKWEIINQFNLIVRE